MPWDFICSAQQALPKQPFLSPIWPIDQSLCFVLLFGYFSFLSIFDASFHWFVGVNLLGIEVPIHVFFGLIRLLAWKEGVKYYYCHAIVLLVFFFCPLGSAVKGLPSISSFSRHSFVWFSIVRSHSHCQRFVLAIFSFAFQPIFSFHAHELFSNYTSWLGSAESLAFALIFCNPYYQVKSMTHWLLAPHCFFSLFYASLWPDDWNSYHIIFFCLLCWHS